MTSPPAKLTKFRYSDYWNQKGEYGRIRFERMLARKRRRSRKRRRYEKRFCRHGNLHNGPEHECPYDKEMNSYSDHDYYPKLCRCCSECMADCAGGI